MRNIKRRITILLFAVCVLATPVYMTGVAAYSNPAPDTPPLERYTCEQVHAPSLTYTYMGYFTLQAGKKYVWGTEDAKPSGRGTYTFDSKGILFAQGPLNGITGQFETQKDGSHLLELTIQGKKQYPDDDGKITWYCSCDKHGR